MAGSLAGTMLKEKMFDYIVRSNKENVIAGAQRLGLFAGEEKPPERIKKYTNGSSITSVLVQSHSTSI